uniref:Brevican n=1 Tax=Apteryx owenii TaxID=8824 RepID=A0A8B9QLK4_APTOW
RMASALPLLLLCAFAPAAAPDAFVPEDDDLKALQVSIPRHPALDAVLAGDVTIPCLITYLRPVPTAGTAGRRAVLGAPRVKWTFLAEGRELEILVARGDRVKVSEDYRLRASLPIFHRQYTNASLLLTELRPNDSGIYRCDVQHGIEDGHDILDLKVKGTPSTRRTTGWWTPRTCTTCTATPRTSRVIAPPRSRRPPRIAAAPALTPPSSPRWQGRSFWRRRRINSPWRKPRRAAGRWEPSWPARASSTRPGAAAWTPAAPAGWPTAASATPSSRRGNAAAGACRESKPSSSSGTRRDSPMPAADTMPTAFEVKEPAPPGRGTRSPRPLPGRGRREV